MKRARSLVLFLIDLFSFYLAFVLSFIFRFGFNKDNFYVHLFSFSFLFLFWFLVFYAFQLYENYRSTLEYYQNYFLALVLNIVLSIILFYIFAPYFQITPKRLLFLFFIFFSIFNLSLRKKYGFQEESKKFLFIDEKTKELDLSIYDIFIVPEDKKHAPLVKDLLLKNKEILSKSEYYEIYYQKLPLEEIEKIIFDLKSESKTSFDLLKRFLDIFLAITVVIITLPLWPIIILGIKLSSKGPIFYLDRRIGFQEKPFILYKFRTMHQKEVSFEKDFTQEKKARLFLFGKILRKTHLDELPQLINVIKGDVSLVGPRPDSEKYYYVLKKEIPYYELRTIVKPGITGWAQIKKIYGDSVEEAKERLAYDLYYIKHRSPILDLLIILKTISILFGGK
jgi:lipopolysaccharide/colanic/teichoic acid biosynthesis glycosyltransferase